MDVLEGRQAGQRAAQGAVRMHLCRWRRWGGGGGGRLSSQV